MCTRIAPNKNDAMTSRSLDRKEVRTCHMASALVLGTGTASGNTGRLLLKFGGRSSPTGLAIVHWIGCINAIKMVLLSFYSLLDFQCHTC